LSVMVKRALYQLIDDHPDRHCEICKFPDVLGCHNGDGFRPYPRQYAICETCWLKFGNFGGAKCKWDHIKMEE